MEELLKNQTKLLDMANRNYRAILTNLNTIYMNREVICEKLNSLEIKLDKILNKLDNKVDKILGIINE